MANRKTKQSYNMTTGGSLKVGKPGIYIIHANVSSLTYQHSKLKNHLLKPFKGISYDQSQRYCDEKNQ